MPKSLPAGTHPVIINWHGGGLITGSAIFPPFFPAWLPAFAISHSAILISPDYTLLPASKGLAAVTADIATFWAWLHTSLPSIFSSLKPGHQLDLSRILVNGGSAGGYLAISLALSHPQEIRAVAVAYPMLDFDSDWYRRGSHAVGAPNVFHMPDDMLPSVDAVRAQIQEMASGPVVAAAGTERSGAFGALAHYGLMRELLFDPEGTLDASIDVWPIRRVKAGLDLPKRVWVMHGDEDSGVPVDGSRVFYSEAMKAASGKKREIRLDIVPGMDHGFDSGPVPERGWKGPDDPLIRDALAWLAEVWLKE